MRRTADVSLRWGATAPQESPGCGPFGPIASIALVLAILALALVIAFAIGLIATGMLHDGGWADFLNIVHSPEHAGGNQIQLGERLSWITSGVWGALLIPFVIALAARRGDVRELLAINFNIPARPMASAIVFAVVITAGEAWLAEIYPPLRLLFSLPHDTLSLVLAAIAIMIVAPIGEELVFRGFLYTSLRERWGYAPSLIVVSVLFSAMHFEATFVYPLLVLPIALVLGWLRERSGGVCAPMLLHVAVNSWAFVAHFATR